MRVYTHPHIPENGNGKIKTKREYVRNGPFCSSPVQLPLNTRSPPVFFKRVPVLRIERGNFFLTPTVFVHEHLYISAHHKDLLIWTCRHILSIYVKA